MAPAWPVVVALLDRRGRWGRRLHEPVLHLGERFELAEIQEDAAAGIALLQVDAVAFIGRHDSCALRTQQRVPHARRRSGLRWFVWRDAHASTTTELPVKCLGTRRAVGRLRSVLD